MIDALYYAYHVYFLWPIQDWLSKTQPIPPYQSACTGDCNQGRTCDCSQQVDEYWPFPRSRP